MGRRFLVSRTNVTPVAGEDVLTLSIAATRRAELVEVSVNGRGTSSAAQVLEVGQSATGVGGGGTITPDALDPDSAAAETTVQTTWGTQPTIDTNKVKLGWNALGGAYRWVKPNGGPGVVNRNLGCISFRCPTGAPTPQAIDIHAIFEEI